MIFALAYGWPHGHVTVCRLIYIYNYVLSCSLLCVLAVTRPVITSVVANQASDGLSEISINWTDENDLSHVNRYAFFFGLQTNDQECISAGTLSERIANMVVVNRTFSATVHHTLDPFVKYTVQVAQDWPGSSIGRKSIAFNFTRNATRK